MIDAASVLAPNASVAQKCCRQRCRRPSCIVDFCVVATLMSLATADRGPLPFPSSLPRLAPRIIFTGSWIILLGYSRALWIRTVKSYPSTDEELLAYQRVRLPRRATFTSILGSSGGRLVPYQLSMENEKRVRAELHLPTGVSPGERYISSWSKLLECLQVMMAKGKSMEVARLKLAFRARYSSELSETVFGYTTLSARRGR